MRIKTKIIIVVLIAGFVNALILYNFSKSWFTYGESGSYRVEMDSVVRHLWVLFPKETYSRYPDVVAKFGVFMCEQDYQLQWKPETPVRYSISGNILFTFSSLYTYDVFKTWIFEPTSFSVEITKAYNQNGFSDNNQIVVDINNNGYCLNNDSSITLLVNQGYEITITITVLSASPMLTIQTPRAGYPSEVQFNFNNASDRTISYHHAGDLETALFNVSIQA